VALQGGKALIGADQYGNSGTGKAYVFTLEDDAWMQTNQLFAGNDAENDEFGWAVALEAKAGLIGAWGATVNGNQGQGAVYIAPLATLR
jgi:hypothetical protein